MVAGLIDAIPGLAIGIRRHKLPMVRMGAPLMTRVGAPIRSNPKCQRNSLNLWPEQHSQRRTFGVFSGSLGGDRGKNRCGSRGPLELFLRSQPPGALTI